MREASSMLSAKRERDAQGGEVDLRREYLLEE